jgi:3-deoxy-7-phosphoheptulonate synthase
MFYPTDDLRIKWTEVVLPLVFLEEELLLTDQAAATVFEVRKETLGRCSK